MRVGRVRRHACGFECHVARQIAGVARLAIAEKGNTDDSGSARVAHDRARDCAFEAARLASQCADAQWEITVLLRVSDTLDRCGDHDDAIALQCRALQLIADENLDPAAAANRRVRPS